MEGFADNNKELESSAKAINALPLNIDFIWSGLLSESLLLLS